MSQDFIGSGLAFPLRTNPTGRVALVSHDREIEESIRLILGTAPGERPTQFRCCWRTRSGHSVSCAMSSSSSSW